LPGVSFHLEGEFWDQAEPGGASHVPGARVQAESWEEGLVGAAQPARTELWFPFASLQPLLRQQAMAQ